VKLVNNILVLGTATTSVSVAWMKPIHDSKNIKYMSTYTSGSDSMIFGCGDTSSSTMQVFRLVSTDLASPDQGKSSDYGLFEISTKSTMYNCNAIKATSETSFVIASITVPNSGIGYWAYQIFSFSDLGSKISY
jgi:hypothetical protein